MAKVKLNPGVSIDEVKNSITGYTVYRRLGQYYIRKKTLKGEPDNIEDIPDSLYPIVISYQTKKKR